MSRPATPRERSPVFALRMGLGQVPASVDEVRREIGERLDAYDARLSQGRSGLELSLTIAAGDIWVALLLAMAAVTGTGYPVVRVDARPSEPPGAVSDRHAGNKTPLAW